MWGVGVGDVEWNGMVARARGLIFNLWPIGRTYLWGEALVQVPELHS